MYINTEQVKLHSQRGWWGISHNPEMSFEVIFGRDDYGSTGARTMKSWARVGRCNRPRGQQAAMWRTLMMLHGARYIAVDYGAVIDIEIMDPDLMNQVKYGPKLKDMQAKVKLLDAAFGSGSTVTTQSINPDKKKIVGGTLLSSQASVRLSSYGTYNAHSREGHRSLFETFVSEFGPPLSPEAMAAFCAEVDSGRKVHAKCRLAVTKDTTHRWARYDADTVIKRKKS